MHRPYRPCTCSENVATYLPNVLKALVNYIAPGMIAFVRHYYMSGEALLIILVPSQVGSIGPQQ